MISKIILFVAICLAAGCNKEDSYIQQAGYTTVNSGNCSYSLFTVNANCGSGYTPVSFTTCCPSTNPYYCNITNKCYQTCAAASAAGCGGSVVKGR